MNLTYISGLYDIIIIHIFSYKEVILIEYFRLDILHHKMYNLTYNCIKKNMILTRLQGFLACIT